LRSKDLFDWTSECPQLRTGLAGAAMENPLPLGLWVGMVLYAALGLFGVVIFHDALITRNLTAGYGIASAE
jgi:hypothetical protein